MAAAKLGVKADANALFALLYKFALIRFRDWL